MLRAARAITVGLSLLGVIVFGALLAAVQSSPRGFEARAQTFIIHEVERQVGVTLESLTLQSLTNRLSEQMQARKREIDARVFPEIGFQLGLQ